MDKINHVLAEKYNCFLNSRGKTTVQRHQIIIFLFHSLLVFCIVGTQSVGLAGSQDTIPLTMSFLHLATCLVALAFFYARKVSAPTALLFVSFVSQITVICRFVYFSLVRPEHYLQFIILNQTVSLLTVVLLVMCFVKYMPIIITLISLVTYGFVSFYLKDASLLKLFMFFFGTTLMLCGMGELLRRNIKNLQTEATGQHCSNPALMYAVKLNEQEIEAYLRISSSKELSPEEADRLFDKFKPKSRHNLIHLVRQHLRSHLLDDCDLTRLCPTLTKSEVDVCNLILQDKKRSEICRLLDKTEKNIDVVRSHVRKKLNVPADQDLKNFLMTLLVERK